MDILMHWFLAQGDWFR